MTLDDTELMLQVRRGGPEGERAFEEIVARNQAMLIAFFHRKSFDRDDAHDRTQEVFLKLWSARASYESRSSFRAYLFQIARNHWIDVLRARRARPHIAMTGQSGDGDETGGIELFAADTRSPLEGASELEVKERVQHAVNALPRGQREVWELAEVEGLRYADIGLMLGIPVGTVKSRHHHAVRRLRELLAATLDPDGDRCASDDSADERGPSIKP